MWGGRGYMRNLFLSILLCNQKKVLKNSLSLSTYIYIYISYMYVYIYVCQWELTIFIGINVDESKTWYWVQKKSHISLKITKLIKLSLKSQYGKFGEVNGNPLQYSCLENLLERRLEWYSPWGSQRFRHNWSDSTAHGKLWGGCHILIIQKVFWGL